MAGVVKKTANALSQESDLLNIHSDYKAVASKFDSLVKTQEEASKRLLKWAEGKDGKGEDPCIQNFIRQVYEMDNERDAVEKRYNEHFRIFVKLWKGILSEKKELNSKFKEFDSARASVKAKNKKDGQERSQGTDTQS